MPKKKEEFIKSRPGRKEFHALVDRLRIARTQGVTVEEFMNWTAIRQLMWNFNVDDINEN